jgi:hypothetical protein
MRKPIASIVLLTLLSGICIAAEPANAPSTAAAADPDGTIVFKGGSVAAGIGYVWGSGELNYHGKVHPFTVSGVSIVDAGASNITATGVVYGLKSASDLNGNFVAAEAGIAIAGGGSATYLKNENGVVIKLLATQVGLRFTLSGEGVKVKLKS